MSSKLNSNVCYVYIRSGAIQIDVTLPCLYSRMNDNSFFCVYIISRFSKNSNNVGSTCNKVMSVWLTSHVKRSLCAGESVNTYFSIIKNKITKIIQHIKAKTIKNINTIGTIFCVAVILPALCEP